MNLHDIKAQVREEFVERHAWESGTVDKSADEITPWLGEVIDRTALAVPKASKREKNGGLDARQGKAVALNTGQAHNVAPLGRETIHKNHHPTVKPLKLMSYLITLGSRPGDVVLDPFMGSGTTCVAAKELGREFVGIEREAEYMEIAEARIGAVPETLFVNSTV